MAKRDPPRLDHVWSLEKLISIQPEPQVKEHGPQKSAQRQRYNSGTMRFSILMAAGAMLLTLPLPMILAQTSRQADVQELERLETVWNGAHTQGDAGALEKLWADDLEIAVPKMPVLTKDSALKFAQSGRMKFLVYKTSDIRVRVYDNAAVVTGRLERTRSMNGQEVSDDWRFTKTYIRESGHWRVVAFHASDSAKP